MDRILLAKQERLLAEAKADLAEALKNGNPRGIVTVRSLRDEVSRREARVAELKRKLTS